MAAISAAESGRAPVILLERTRDGGRKILISGGGRCNILPSQLDPRDYVTASSPHTMKKLLLSWPLREQRRFFEEGTGIPLKLEAESGKLFPVSDRARDVRDGLVDRARHAGVRIRFEASVEDLIPPASPSEGWRVALSDGETIEAGRVILATGGLSVPATGSDGTGLRILKRLGHTIHDLYPALTPLVANPAVHSELAGVSLEATLVAPRSGGGPAARRAKADRREGGSTVVRSPLPVGGKREDRGGFLFTPRGYSGPVVLNLSHHAILSRIRGEAQTLLVQWTGEGPEIWDDRLRTVTSGGVAGLLRGRLPARLADRLLMEAEVDPATPLARLSKVKRRTLAHLLGGYPLPWTGDEGYRKAEVTGGGVALDEVHPHTLESRLHRNLYLCGELLDAFGPIGGYNFAWAWATGRTAGLSAGS
jgi:predicted flavoprotein YhiN